MVGETVMSERENMFARIREALSIEAHARGVKGLPTPADHRRVLPPVGTTFDEQLKLFAKNAADLRATFYVVKDFSKLTAELRAMRDTEGWQRLAAHRGELADTAAQSLGLSTLITDDSFDKNELARCDVSISECDALIAQTGTVVVTSRTAGGRALSVLPPHHVVIARREQLVPDLPTAFALIKAKHAANYPSMISFITGPSRTGDIERILVLGAHGPKKLTIFCLGD
jgi:L-lactate dehydrogenase complex protein LldG